VFLRQSLGAGVTSDLEISSSGGSSMASKAERLKKLLASGRKVANSAQKSFLKAEDQLASIEDRESRRATRQAERIPEVGRG
jgi:hypothetical protein